MASNLIYKLLHKPQDHTEPMRFPTAQLESVSERAYFRIGQLDALQQHSYQAPVGAAQELRAAYHLGYRTEVLDLQDGASCARAL